MTVEDTVGACAVCRQPGSVTMEPPRRTLARGADPADPSLSIIAVLPDLVLCVDHADEVGRGEVTLGWCDNEMCRCYGTAGLDSPCGDVFKTLKR